MHHGTHTDPFSPQVDRLYGWKSVPNSPIMDALERQAEHVRTEFEQRMDKVGKLWHGPGGLGPQGWGVEGRCAGMFVNQCLRQRGLG